MNIPGTREIREAADKERNKKEAVCVLAEKIYIAMHSNLKEPFFAPIDAIKRADMFFNAVASYKKE